jgi:hypothetical protein
MTDILLGGDDVTIIDDMVERLRKEAVAQNSCIMLPPLVSAWAELPA